MNIVNIIAHRGASKRAPQNTLPAFEKALMLGTDGFETDVHLSKDGVPVICHNKSINATSDGKGKIARLTIEQLKKFDFGSYFSKEFKDTRLPTLEEFLDFVQGKGLKVLNIELKPEHNKYRRSELVKKTLDNVKAHDLEDILLISSFSPKILKLCKEYSPSCKTAYLYPYSIFMFWQMFIPPYKLMEKLGCDAAHPHYLCVRGDFVEKCHELGIRVNCWTVDEIKKITALIKANVDGIITNTPDRIQAIFA